MGLGLYFQSFRKLAFLKTLGNTNCCSKAAFQKLSDIKAGLKNRKIFKWIKIPNYVYINCYIVRIKESNAILFYYSEKSEVYMPFCNLKHCVVSTDHLQS